MAIPSKEDLQKRLTEARDSLTSALAELEAAVKAAASAQNNPVEKLRIDGALQKAHEKITAAKKELQELMLHRD